jgi:hypothetical protein
MASPRTALMSADFIGCHFWCRQYDARGVVRGTWCSRRWMTSPMTLKTGHEAYQPHISGGIFHILVIFGNFKRRYSDRRPLYTAFILTTRRRERAISCSEKTNV